MFKRYFKTISIFTLTQWQRQSEYRLAALLWIANGFIVPLILMSVWLLIREQQELPLNNDQIISYFLLTTVIVRLTQSWVGEHLGDKIKDGLLSKHLVMPLPYWIPEISRDFALKLVRSISLLPFIYVFFVLFRDSLLETLVADNSLAFVVAVVIGYLINFILQNIVGLAAFWVQHTFGVFRIFETVVYLFSGMVIPLPLMPESLQRISRFLPFHYILSYPISLLMEPLPLTQVAQELLTGIVWTIVLALTWKKLYQIGIRSYSAVGI